MPIYVSCRSNSAEGPEWAVDGLYLSLRVPSLFYPQTCVPRGLPSEFALVLTLLMKKHTHRNTWYLFQVTDGDGNPQVSLVPCSLHPVALGYRAVPVQSSFCPSL